MISPRCPAGYHETMTFLLQLLSAILFEPGPDMMRRSIRGDHLPSRFHDYKEGFFEGRKGFPALFN